MPYYLQMDGVDDKVTVLANKPSNVTEFIIDCNIEVRTDWMQFINIGGRAINFTSTTMNVAYHADFKEVYVDGVLVTSGTPFIPLNKRITIRGVLKDGINTGPNGPCYFFTNSGSQFVKGIIYDIKVLKLEVLSGWYDLSTGTVNDQTGNGNHAQLIGGTWGNDSSLDVSYNYSTHQRIYTNQLIANGTKQVIQTIRSVASASKQTIWSNQTSAVATKQALFAIRTVNNITLQSIFNEYVPFVISYPMRIGIIASHINQQAIRIVNWSVRQTTHASRQRIYQNQSAIFLIRQSIVKNVGVPFTVKQFIFSERSIHYSVFITSFDPDKTIVKVVKLEASRILKVELRAVRKNRIELRGET
ncbi:hypothetical protein AB4Z17_08515 [Paenibacillus sp. TAF43_2]|uniref:hypothetical protein n=1 Tax=Paenibacillus sp. TAF43_2 TaxID=3233069 RepID=UPI003F983BB1